MSQDDRATFYRTFLQFAKLHQSVLRPVVGQLDTECNIEPGMFAVLVYLHDARDSSGVVPLAVLQRLMRARYSQPGLSRLVKRMEARGLIKRATHPTDGRATILALTRSGNDLYKRSVRVYQDALWEVFGSHLSDDEVEELAKMITKLSERVGIDAASPQ